MLLWDYEMAGKRIEIGQLTEARRKRLALEIIEASAGRFRPSFEMYFSPLTVSFFRSTIARFRDWENGGDASGVDWEEFYRELYHLEGVNPAPGVASLVMALSCFAEGIAGSNFDAETTFWAMSACYEAIVNSEKIPRVTPDAERANLNCVGVIEMQLSMLRDARSM